MSDNPEWRDSLPEALQNAPYFKPLEDGTPRSVDQIVSDLSNAAALQGNLAETHIRIPKSDAAEAERQQAVDRALQAFENLTVKPDLDNPDTMRIHYQALGVPEKAEQYRDPEIEGFNTEGVDLGKVREMALANNWTQTAYENYVQDLAAGQKRGIEELAQWKNDQQSALNEKLGGAKEGRVTRIINGLEKVGYKDLADKVQAGEVDAGIVLAFDAMIDRLVNMGGEGRQFADQTGSGARTGFTPEEARAKMEEITEQLLKMKPGSAKYNELMAKRVEYVGMMSGR